MPVPHPVLVTSWRTGNCFVGSGSDPHEGFPPGPPLAATIGRLSGYVYGSLPNKSPASTIRLVVRDMMARQTAQGNWIPIGLRPPLEYYPFSATAMVIRALRMYGAAQ